MIECDECHEGGACGELCSTSRFGLLTLHHAIPDSPEVKYQPRPDYYTGIDGCFAVNCDSKIIVGGGYNENVEMCDESDVDESDESDVENVKNVFLFEDNGYKEIQPLNYARYDPSAVYYSSTLSINENVLIVMGGRDKQGRDTDKVGEIEYLVMNDSFGSNHWKVCSDTLPDRLTDYQLNVHNNQLILTGGICDEQLELGLSLIHI